MKGGAATKAPLGRGSKPRHGRNQSAMGCLTKAVAHSQREQGSAARQRRWPAHAERASQGGRRGARLRGRRSGAAVQQGGKAQGPDDSEAGADQGVQSDQALHPAVIHNRQHVDLGTRFHGLR